MVGVAPNGFPQRDDLSFVDGVVVRRHDNVAIETVLWIHSMLDRLSFNAPRPVPHFDGVSVTVIDGVVWSALSFVEGETVGWSSEPTMFDLGAFLASFHEAAAAVEMDVQQAPVFSIDTIAPAGHAGRLRQVIHGDPTNHNVLGARIAPAAVRNHRLRQRVHRRAAVRHRVHVVAQRSSIAGCARVRPNPGGGLCGRLQLRAAALARRPSRGRRVPAGPRRADHRQAGVRAVSATTGRVGSSTGSAGTAAGWYLF